MRKGRAVGPMSDVIETVEAVHENQLMREAAKFGTMRKRMVCAEGVYWTMVASGAAFVFGAAWMFYAIVRRR
ncbi:MAG: hypothetical protein KF812_02240 [Fimbriimonadaceae bacterium]|nr:hypothetical protein [Fimbriimonadaceae bacterium]